MIAKLLALLRTSRRPKIAWPGWRLSWAWYYWDSDGGATIWLLKRRNGKLHAIIGARSDRREQYYDAEHEFSPRRN